jgi:hypothetical protein
VGKYFPRIALVNVMVIDLSQKIELWRFETAVLKLVFKRHETDPPLSSSKQQAA